MTDSARNSEQYIDLHVHSNCSDGAFSPTELVSLAVQQGLSTIAIADHDSIEAIQEALTASVRAGIENIPAVELSIQYGSYRDVHLLGYGIDHMDAAFRTALGQLRVQREQRNVEVLARINARFEHEGREKIELSQVLAFAKGVIGRPHIARALLERGYVKNVEEAFRRYLIPCNVPKQYWPVQEAIAEIRRLGGLAVLAHPTTITPDIRELEKVLEELTGMGLDGIEAFNNLAQAEEMEFLQRKADALGIIVTGGSDFHGIEAGLEMGRGRGGIRFSMNLLVSLRQRLSKRNNNKERPE